MHGFEGLGTDSAHANFARRNFIVRGGRLHVLPGCSLRWFIHQGDDTGCHHLRCKLADSGLLLSLPAQDDTSQLQWWKLLLCAADSWRPGLREGKALREGKPVAHDASKWRDLVVR